jgi:hypothetical protein
MPLSSCMWRREEEAPLLEAAFARRARCCAAHPRRLTLSLSACLCLCHLPKH